MKKFLMSFAVVAVVLACVQGGLSAVDPGKSDALKRFSQVLDIVSRYYVKEVSTSELIDGALKGMLQSLDAHSTMMDAKEFRELQQSTSGEFFGIGIEITQENGQLVVVTPIEDTPAYKAGLKPGDIIIKINDESTHEMSLNDAVSRIRGKKGTPVSLTALHKNSTEPFVAKMKRDAIPIKSIKSRRLEAGYYWIRLTRFSEKTAAELHEALAAAKAESGAAGLKGIILDMRFNPGGLLDAAISVSDTFLDSGTIVSVRGRAAGKEQKFTASRQKDDVSVPLVVLVNGGSASASEIVAAALADNKRALIVGEQTFGKGSVQNLMPMADGTGLKLTIAMYYTPSGRSIQTEGVKPDLLIPYEAPRKDAGSDPYAQLTVREKDLNKHLAKPDQETAAAPEEAAQEKDEAGKWLSSDNQLRMSLQLVKSLPRISGLK